MAARRGSSKRASRRLSASSPRRSAPTARSRQGWDLDEATWEPLSNILTANAEVRQFEEVLAAMPKLDSFVAASSSGCCFGKLCELDRLAGPGPSLDKCTSCGSKHHHLCATENREAAYYLLSTTYSHTTHYSLLTTYLSLAY